MKDKTKEQLIEEIKELRQRITELELSETELEQAVNALRESEERYRRLFQQSVEAIYMFDPETKRILETNNAFLDLLGYTAEEVRALTVYDFVVHKRQNIDAYIHHILTSGAIIIGERIWRHKDKTLVDVQISASKIKQRGKDICFVVARNITDLKQAEDDLRKSENKYRVLIENLPQKIFLKDRNSVYISCNENYARDLGINPHQIAGKTDYDFYPKELADKYRADDKRIMESGKTEDIEEKYIQDGTESLVQTVKIPIKDREGNIISVQGIFWDITKRKRAENELLAAKERLQTLSKSSLKTLENERRHIARELHDEIGQELTALRINLENMQQLSDPQMFRNYIKENLAIIDRLLQQVQNLSLDLRPSILDDLGLIPALRWYVRRLEQEVGFNIQFIADSLDHRLPTEIETACFRVVQEALTNVVRHAKARQVTVELRQKEREPQLTVSDDGVGFNVESTQARAMLGESFGLLGMQERVILAGGIIEIESMPSRGTKVIAYFPTSES